MTRAPYKGPSRGLVLAFDIGTTYSGVAYTFVEPGEVPQICLVTRYPGNSMFQFRIPSILYYDQNGNFRGAEDRTGLQEDKSLLQMRWWKLSLGPAEPSGSVADLKKEMSTDLPRGKTLVDVFSDFMRYLFDSTKTFCISCESTGECLWNSVSGNIELVLTHPNGWGARQQQHLQAAAVRAEIVPDTPTGHARVHFVTEGEAIVNFCATHTKAGENLKHGNKILVIHAGEGTIDISSYAVASDAPLQVEELFRPGCLLQGGEFVTARARDMVAEKLKNSKFNTPEYIDAFAQKFDKGLKRVFFDDKALHYVKFGSPMNNDPEHGIKAGRLALTGKEVAGFFEPSIQSTVDFIRENFIGIPSMNTVAFLVGSLSSSPWFTDQLNRRLSDLGLTFSKPDTNTDKAVAVGAISFHIGRFVHWRISRFTYGVPSWVVYKPSDPEHVKREHKTFIDAQGKRYLPGFFKTILSKGTNVLESHEIRVRKYAQGRNVLVPIIRYVGNEKEPTWMDVELDRFETLCHVVADISGAPCKLSVGESSKAHSSREYDVVLFVGLKELKAQIRWIDSTTGLEESSDATVVYREQRRVKR